MGRSQLFLLPFALLLVPAVAARPTDETWTVLLSGDADGYLAPCGCTSPMSGGLKRRTTALRGEVRHVVLDNGGLASGTDRQGVLKAETAAQALELSHVDAANFTARDAQLGSGEALSLVHLSGGRLISTSLRSSPSVPVAPWREAGPFLIGGATARPEGLGQGLRETAMGPVEAARRLVEESASRQLKPVLLFDGDRYAALAVARAVPDLRLVSYRATGLPPSGLERLGTTGLATPGERGKAVIRLIWRDDAFVSARVESLGPEVPEDPAAEALYRTYLRRVSTERLLEKAPHVAAKGFAGSTRCSSCHAEAAKVWQKSDHAHALATLERVGNQRDPDCVPCHVVGQKKVMAFRSRTETPALANVGCESCHGAGAAHASSPLKVRLPKVGQNSCLPCHDPENSPRFEFSAYWARVRHGRR